jgi:hypothetical protein
MAFFNFFQKDHKASNSTTENGVLGPTYLDGLTGHIQNPNDLHDHEWRRQLKSASGHTNFKIKFYGQLHEDYPNLIVGTDFAPSLIFAVDALSGQEFLLFDGCAHGYNALFCDSYSEEQIAQRPTTHFYRDPDGEDTFEIVISTYNGVDFADEFADEMDENGFIEILNGTKMSLEDVRRNGYDTLQIWATNALGKTVDCVSEELA